MSEIEVRRKLNGVAVHAIDRHGMTKAEVAGIMEAKAEELREAAGEGSP